MVSTAATQHRRGREQLPQRADQAGIGQGRHRHPHRQFPAQHERQRNHDDRSAAKHDMPAAAIRYQARRRTRQHDANQHAAHHLAHGTSARCFLRQVRSEGNQDLRRDRPDAHHQRRHQEQRWAGADRCNHQRDRGEQQHAEHHAAVFQEVAQRHHKQQADRIADLRQGNDEPGGARRQAGGCADRADQRLRVIQVCHDQSRCNGEQQHHARRNILLDFSMFPATTIHDEFLCEKNAKGNELTTL